MRIGKKNILYVSGFMKFIKIFLKKNYTYDF